VEPAVLAAQVVPVAQAEMAESVQQAVIQVKVT
jgi:hypothetical protein